jgi:hypothetical protein
VHGYNDIFQILEDTGELALSITLISYNRQVMSVQDVTSIIQFNIDGTNENIDERSCQALIEGFKTCFTNYLKGIGHVPGCESLVDADEYRKRKTDRLFRARAALRQFTDSWQLPIDRHEGTIKVKCR